jgi:hypothetical protein
MRRIGGPRAHRPAVQHRSVPLAPSSLMTRTQPVESPPPPVGDLPKHDPPTRTGSSPRSGSRTRCTTRSTSYAVRARACGNVPRAGASEEPRRPPFLSRPPLVIDATSWAWHRCPMRQVAAIVALGTALAWIVAASAGASGQPLANALVVATGDVPSHWGPWHVRSDPIVACVEASTTPVFTARARSALGTPNSGIASIATVFASRRQAAGFYAGAVAALPACVKSFLASRQSTKTLGVERLEVRRFGRRFGLWRLRYLTGSPRTSRHALDWAVVNTGTAVLVDVFEMGTYDDHWNDVSAARGLGGSVAGIERQALTRAARRAAVLTPGA